MNYECKRCGKKAKTKSGLRCEKCDIQESQLAGTHMIYPTPPGPDEIREIFSERNESINKKAADGQSNSPLDFKTMTNEMADAWDAMGLTDGMKIERLCDWANMLERRIAEFDSSYRAYHWDRKSA